MKAASALLQQLVRETRESSTVRLGLIAVGAIVWLYILLVARDALAPARERLALLQDRVEAARSVERETGWPARAAAAQGELNALRAMLWPAPSRSLAEAAFRDWIQSTAQASGLKVRALTVQAVDTGTAKTSGAATPASAPLPDDVDRVRAHLAVMFEPQAWAAFLSKLASSTHVVGVERLAVHSATNQGAVSELDLEALFALGRTGS